MIFSLYLQRRRKGGRRFYADATTKKSVGASSPIRLCRRKGGLGNCPIFSILSSLSGSNGREWQGFQYDVNDVDKQFSLTRWKLSSEIRKRHQHRSAQALPKLPSLATPWVELGYTLGRVCEICSEHYTCRLACPRLNDSGSKENLRHNCATIVRVLRHNCSAVAQQSPVRLCVSRGGHRYFRPAKRWKKFFTLFLAFALA